MHFKPLRQAFLEGRDEDLGGGKGGRVAYRHQLPHSPDETRKRKHFPFTPIFCQLVVLTRFEPVHTAAAEAAVLYHRKE